MGKLNKHIDTSPQYGNSEEIIGSFIHSNISKEKIFVISKLSAIKNKDGFTIDRICNEIKAQIKYLFE